MTTDRDVDTMLTIGAPVPDLVRRPDPIDLFTFSAASWLLHRIHYDLPFTTDHDGHPGLLVQGPLQGTYMIQSVQWWLGPDARLRSIAYRHSSPVYAGETLTCGGTITGIDSVEETFDVELWVKTNDGTITTSGTATFAIPPEQIPTEKS